MSKRPDAYQRMTSKVFDEFENTCWLSGFEDPYRVVVHEAHIFDKVLCEGDDSLTEAMYSYSNRLRLTASIHAVFDARLLVINQDGSITTALSDTQLKAIGLTRSAHLPQQCLTPERVKFLKHRINDRGAFHLASEMARHCKRVQQRETTSANRSVGGGGAGDDV